MKQQLMLKVFTILCSCCLLIGCSLKPLPAEVKNTYILSPATTIVAVKAPTAATLLIARPRAAAGFDTGKMAYQTEDYKIAYFTENRWVDEPSQMLEPLLIEVLQRTKKFHAVVGMPYSGKADFRLSTDLLQFQQNFMYNPSLAQLAIRVRLVDEHSEKVIASRQFVVTAEAPSNDPYGGVIALNQATQTFLKQLAQFVTAAVEN